ncbi:hypothetical protein QE152_g40581 [Popillia japonica]|uniref:Uncharacterized protein n=2 Tax=Popillia japonica TaxID=7064 RepID=A0AAW1HFZ8_POPJA
MTTLFESNKSTENVGKIKTFSDVTKRKQEVIILKPVNENQRSERTQQEIKMKIDPSKLAIGIEKINNIGKGGVAISCVNNNSKEKLKTTVEKELGGNYEVIEPKLKKPQMIVTGVELEVINQDNENILKSIIEQNQLHTGESMCSEISIHRKFTNKNKKNYGNVIINVEPEMYRKLMNLGKINIGWKRCDIQ